MPEIQCSHEKYILLIALIFGFSLSQETKVGTIDVDFVLSKMPELTDIQEQVEIFSSGLEGELTKRRQALENEIKKYQEEEVGLTINQKKVRQDSIIAMEGNINKFQQNGNQLIYAKQEELMQPLYNKIGTALEK